MAAPKLPKTLVGLGDPSKPAPVETVPPHRPVSGAAPKLRRRSSRPPLAVDDFGDVAVGLAARSQSGVPRRLKSDSELGGAPIDARDAFLLGLVDGQTTLAALVDLSAMSEASVKERLARLARLGLVALA